VHFSRQSNPKSSTAKSLSFLKPKNKLSDIWTKTLPLCAPYWNKNISRLR
jgi:hypothetical protein